ncbi:hypothetical protein [Saliphagus infecundisoli]|uniref:KTSC domain-containing protein n=1 Tax=Saliphagus infecundisoli TaxID=1849069 RepID=A0ABD5QIJ0_9EURY|nr:hypothetical protein [Saliphagus infecundisoli]
MTRYTRTKEKRTDPRPAYIPLGVDTEDASYVYHTRTESVYTIEGTTVAYHQSLEGHSINVYMDYVADRRGWADRRLHRTLGDGLEQANPPEAV